MSKISAKRGGSLSICQLIRNQSKWAECFAPRFLNSGNFIKRLENNWGSLAWFLPTWTFKASINLSWCCSITLISVTPGRSADKRTTAEKSPNSVSLRAKELKLAAKWNSEDTKSGCKKKKIKTKFRLGANLIFRFLRSIKSYLHRIWDPFAAL